MKERVNQGRHQKGRMRHGLPVENIVVYTIESGTDFKQC